MGKIGIKSFFVIGICAILFIVGAKVVFTKVNIPAVSTLVAAA